MKTIRFNTYLILVLLASTFNNISAQSTNINWSAVSTNLKIDNVNTAIESNLILQGNSFVWEQISNGNLDTELFDIISIQGTWDSSQHTGELHYHLLYGNLDASLTIEGTSEGININLVVNSGNDDPVFYNFQINSFNYL